ncbi:aminotransferase class V-fold PLP-dependent enzyme [bacterium]|nr:aminotransferase class V-fold PLP-dependent enzyme [bacterium]
MFEIYRQGLAVLEQKELFLNYAATAPLSRSVIEQIKAETEAMASPLGQRFYVALNQLEQARRLVAELLNVKASELAFTTNTSTAISLVALGLEWKSGDRVLVASNEFPSNYYPWLHLEKRGVICQKFTPRPGLPLHRQLAEIDLKGIKLLALSAVSYETGRLYELQQVVRFCREQGILTCLDCIQAIGATPFDLREIDADFAVSGAQKWLMGPVGCGILYAQSKHLEALDVPFLGWTSVKYPELFDLGPLQYPPEMTRFEPGLPNYLSVVGLAASLRQLQSLDWVQIHAAIRRNTLYLQQSLRELGFSLLTSPGDGCAGIVSFRVPEDFERRQVEQLYHDHHIKITARNDYVRVSPHFFNTPAELDRFLQASQRIFLRSPAHQAKLRVNHPEKSRPATPGQVLITGATGNLGSCLARRLAAKGYALHLLGRDAEKLEALRQQLAACPVDLRIDQLDFLDHQATDEFLARLEREGKSQYQALIQCAGREETSLFSELESEAIAQLMRVNLDVPTRLMHLFLRTLRHPDPLGVLNIVSSTGRCGTPLLSVYAAAHGAMWTLGESLAREWNDRGVTITTYVAPAMHSPMQKRMGRVSLRFFKMSGSFDYEVVDRVAREALRALFKKRSLKISKLSKAKLFLNQLLPGVIDEKVRKVWRPDH